MMIGDIQGQERIGNALQEQEEYLLEGGMSSRGFHRTNVIKRHVPKPPKGKSKLDTVDQAEKDRWFDALVDEISIVNPSLIITMGPFVTRWFLGQSTNMEAVHGILCEAGTFDPDCEWTSQGALVYPIYHPSYGAISNDARAKVAEDHYKLPELVRKIRNGHSVVPDTDQFAGYEDYVDVSGAELADYLNGYQDVIGLDTEGTPSDPWSIQISVAPGQGVVMRTTRDDFTIGIAALAAHVEAGSLFSIHNAMYDIEMSRNMGLDLFEANIWDTMYAAYLMRIEPQALKSLAYRKCRMKMGSYLDTVGDAGIDKQLDYLNEVLDLDISAPEPYERFDNNGTSKLYKPQSITRRVRTIILDVCSSKMTKKGPSNPYDRWTDTDYELRKPAEDILGPMPLGTLADIPLDKAVYYSARDADASVRTYYELVPELEKLDLTRTMSDCMDVLPVFEEIQATGMPADKQYFIDLAERMTTEIRKLQKELSTKYYDSKPINPKSPLHVANLLKKRGLEGRKPTATGNVSTSKDSIEYLKYTDPAIKLVFECRDRQHIRDSFCRTAIEQIPPGVNHHNIRCQIKTTRTASRRLAASDPNLLAIPSRTELGKLVRQGYICKEGELLGSWDLGQIEFRYAAHESEDKLLCQIIRDGADIHTETAARIFNILVENVHKDHHRAPAKTTGFGIFYGMSGTGLLTLFEKLNLKGWTTEKCDKMIEDWLRVYSGIDAYIKATSEDLIDNPIVRDHWGMMRHLPNVHHRQQHKVEEACRMAVSHKIQGGAQGMIQNSMTWMKPIIRKMQKQGANIHWCLQVHDEVILRFDEELEDETNEIVMEALTKHSGIDLRVPIVADGSCARTWGALK